MFVLYQRNYLNVLPSSQTFTILVLGYNNMLKYKQKWIIEPMPPLFLFSAFNYVLTPLKSTPSGTGQATHQPASRVIMHLAFRKPDKIKTYAQFCVVLLSCRFKVSKANNGSLLLSTPGLESAHVWMWRWLAFQQMSCACWAVSSCG